jgi:uncharacterized protein
MRSILRITMALVLLSQALLCAAAEPANRASAANPPSAAEVRDRLELYFFEAARRGDEPMLREFIAAGYDLNTRTDKGYTALILAAYHGHAATVEQLIAAGADPCAQDQRGNTALMGALFKGELSVARRLLNAPCQPDQRNKAGQTAAMYAALFGRTEILKELEAKGADLNTEDGAGNSARSLAHGEIRTASPPTR